MSVDQLGYCEIHRRRNTATQVCDSCEADARKKSADWQASAKKSEAALAARDVEIEALHADIVEDTRNILREFQATPEAELHESAKLMRDRIAKVYAEITREAVATARREALEEAAQFVNDYNVPGLRSAEGWVRADLVADGLRALAAREVKP